MRLPSPSGRPSPSKVRGGDCETERRARARGFPFSCSPTYAQFVPFLQVRLCPGWQIFKRGTRVADLDVVGRVLGSEP